MSPPLLYYQLVVIVLLWLKSIVFSSVAVEHLRGIAAHHLFLILVQQGSE